MVRDEDFSGDFIGWFSARDGAVERIELGIEISEAEYGHLARCAGCIRSAESSFSFILMRENWEALTGLVGILEGIRYGEGKRTPYRPSVRRQGWRLLSVVANFLNSVRMYTDSTLDALSALYGKTDAAYQRFEKDLSSCFDRSQGYRFSYHLRNGLQHTGALPLRISKGDGPLGSAELRLTADRDQLLLAYDWHRQVRIDLLNGPDVVDIFPLLESAWRAVVWVEHRRAGRAYAAIVDEISALRDALRSVLIPAGAYPVIIRVRPNPEGGLSTSYQDVPDEEELDALLGAIGRGAAVEYLQQIRREQDVSSEPAVTFGEGERRAYEAALPILESWHALGPEGAVHQIREVISAGPVVSGDALIGLLNIAGMVMSEVDLVFGVGGAQRLATIRELIRSSSITSEDSTDDPMTGVPGEGEEP